MWNEPGKERLSEIPKLYETEDIPPEEKLICLHFFIGGCDWYISEFDGEDLFFGFAILNNDYLNAEWGYISFEELRSVKIHGFLEIECETSWKICKAKDIERIAQACGGKGRQHVIT